MMKRGTRVFALSSANADEKEVLFLGLGVYVGDEIPGPEAGGLAAWAHKAGEVNPKLVLDDGTVVWGGECWWGPEEDFKRVFTSPPWTIIPALISDLREKERAALAKSAE